MKIYNIIIGKRSFLTSSLRNFLKKPEIISLNKINKINFKKKYKPHILNIVINHFYPISKINKKNNENNFKKSTKQISSLLNFLEEFNIKKIIFSSSSAIYGRKKNHLGFGRNIYGQAKYDCEQLIKKFCYRKKCH